MYYRIYGRSILPIFHAALFLSVGAIEYDTEEGKQLQCACTTQDCRDARRTTCVTNHMCYTQLLANDDGSEPVTRGCIDRSIILCEKHTITKGWMYLNCCGDKDMCNERQLTTSATPAAAAATGPLGRRPVRPPLPIHHGYDTQPTVANTEEGMSEEQNVEINITQPPFVIVIGVVGTLLFFTIIIVGFYVLKKQNAMYLQRETYINGRHLKDAINI